MQNKHGIAVANIDFSKAFDSVSHDKLLARFAQYGVCGTLLLWLQRFFSDRTHQTRIGRPTSLLPVAHLLSGVVQGSSIGPIAFIIHAEHVVHSAWILF